VDHRLDRHALKGSTLSELPCSHGLLRGRATALREQRYHQRNVGFHETFEVGAIQSVCGVPGQVVPYGVDHLGHDLSTLTLEELGDLWLGHKIQARTLPSRPVPRGPVLAAL
jgi:hypothetical protein